MDGLRVSADEAATALRLRRSSLPLFAANIPNGLGVYRDMNRRKILRWLAVIAPQAGWAFLGDARSWLTGKILDLTTGNLVGKAESPKVHTIEARMTISSMVSVGMVVIRPTQPPDRSIPI
jgi:hypothetical protein